MPTRKIEELLGLNRRTVRSVIERERRNGAQIISFKGYGGGICLAGSDEEFDLFMYNQRQELKTREETLDIMEQTRYGENGENKKAL